MEAKIRLNPNGVPYIEIKVSSYSEWQSTLDHDAEISFCNQVVNQGIETEVTKVPRSENQYVLRVRPRITT